MDLEVITNCLPKWLQLLRQYINFYSVPVCSCTPVWWFEGSETVKTDKYKSWREQEMQFCLGENLVIQTTWFNSWVPFTQQSMCLVVEASEAQTLLVVAVTLMLLVFKVPGQNQMPFKSGCSKLQKQHTDLLTITKWKSEHFAPNGLFPTTSHCFGSTVPGLLSSWSRCSDSSNRGSYVRAMKPRPSKCSQ